MVPGPNSSLHGSQCPLPIEGHQTHGHSLLSLSQTCPQPECSTSAQMSHSKLVLAAQIPACELHAKQCPAFITLFHLSKGHSVSCLIGEETTAQRAEFQALFTQPGSMASPHV
jgi:hypothetical protein